MTKILIKQVHAIDPQLNLDKICDIFIEDGKIASIGASLSVPDVDKILYRKDCIATPGLIDLHVHLRDPGFEYKETIETGTKAAAHGGFTDICSMANTNPVTDVGALIDYIKYTSQSYGYCNVFPVGACTKGLEGKQLAEIGDMVAHGAVAFSDDGHGIQNTGIMRNVMDYVTMFDKVVMSHCQDESLVENGQINEGKVSTKLGLAGWPAAGEEIQIQRDITLSELTGCPIHIQHVSTARGLEIIKEGKKRGVQVTTEVTPHHLFLSEDIIATSYDTNYKVNPPLRTHNDRLALIDGLKQGTIDCIVTDHAPHAAYEKQKEFELAPFGMSGLETSLATVLTFLVKPGYISYSKLVELMVINPRKIIRVDPVKLKIGDQANITIIDPNKIWKVEEDELLAKSKNYGFLNYTLTGKAKDVICKGNLTMEEGQICD